MRCNVSFKMHFLDSSLRLLPRIYGGSERWEGTAISTGYFYHGKNDTKASWAPLCWPVTAGHLEQTFIQAECSRKSSTITFWRDNVFLRGVHLELDYCAPSSAHRDSRTVTHDVTAGAVSIATMYYNVILCFLLRSLYVTCTRHIGKTLSRQYYSTIIDRTCLFL